MGGYYGHNPESYVPDSSHWEKMFGIAANTILQMPKVIEAQKSLDEGRITNRDIYDGFKNQIANLPDDEVKTYFNGYDKATLLKMTTPGRNEGGEYFARFAKITGTGLTTLTANQNLNTASGRIEAIGRNKDVADEVSAYRNSQGIRTKMEAEAPGFESSMQTAKTEGAGTTGPSSPVNLPNYASPEEITNMARKYNVPIESLSSEMEKSKRLQDAQQLRKLDTSGTQASQIQAIGSEGKGMGDLTRSAVGTLNTEYQEGSQIIAGANAQSNQLKADTDARAESRRMVEAKTSSTKELLNNRKSYITEIKNYQSALGDIDAELNKPIPYGVDDKDYQAQRKDLIRRQTGITRDLINARKEISNINKNIGSELGIDLGSDFIDDEVIEAYNSIKTKGAEPAGGIEAGISAIVKASWGMDIPMGVVKKQLAAGATPIQILQALYEMRQ